MNDYKPFTRADLLTFAVDDGERQGQAWFKLRRVCIDLRLKVPTMAQVRDMDADLDGIYVAVRQQYSDLFDEEYARFVLCEPEDGGEQVFVQYDAGYQLE